MFRDDTQRGLVCAILAARLPGGSERWFAPDKLGILRPTDEAWDAIENGAPMSSGELLMLRAAIDVWNGAGGLVLGRALDTLDSRYLGLLGSFLVAYARGPHAIGAWVAENTR